MDWLWQLIESFQKSSVWTAFQQFATGDWIVLFAVLWGMATGVKKGASDMFTRVLVLLLTGVIALTFYSGLAASLTNAVPALPKAFAEPLVYLVLTGVVWFFMTGCVNFVGKFCRVEAHGALKTFGGMFLGGVFFLLLISLAAQFLRLIPVGSSQKNPSRGHSITWPVVEDLFPRIQGVVDAAFLKGHAKVVGSGKTSQT